MPDNDLQESTEIKENNQLTMKQEDDTLRKLEDTHTKINDYYLKRREPLKEDPAFELFDKIEREQQ
jgi:hypothetical protein